MKNPLRRHYISYMSSYPNQRGLNKENEQNSGFVKEGEELYLCCEQLVKD